MVASPFSLNFQSRRSAIEYLTFSRFYFEVDGKTRLLISKASGVAITIEVTDQTKPIGSTKGAGAGARTQTQATPTGVSTQNITLEFVSTGDNNTLLDWYLRCHPKPRDGGPRKQMEQRLACSLVFYNQDGTEGARWNIVDAIPAKYKTTKVSADSNDLFKETVEIAHAGLVRVNIN
ncbi:phage tail protein [Pantanalinema rosaneae CENA516]|uniref:phage tail protein n=1 Tax=Pantanalinema rosaneae TaxID=1620701 RepID=UPI003D6ECCB9